MDNPKNINCFFGDPKNRPVISVKDMPVFRSQNFIFRSGRASFRKMLKGGDLILNPDDKSFGFVGTVFANIVPNPLQIPLSGTGNLNQVSIGHA